MKTSTFLATANLAAAAAVTPLLDINANAAVNISALFSVHNEDNSRAGIDDFKILSFALVLEHLEAAFYAEAVKKFTEADFSSFGIPDLYNNVLRLARDEAVHADVLTTVLTSLKQKAPGPCKYQFPYTDAKGFLGLAAVIEGVGVSAYSGAPTSITNPSVLQMAAGILPIEARHDAILRAASGLAPYPSPFDTPLDFNQVWTLASQFFVPDSCPSDNVDLGLTAFPALALTNSGTAALKTGSKITLQASIDSSDNQRRSHVHKRHNAAARRAAHAHERKDNGVYAAFLTVQGAKLMPTTQDGNNFATEIPEGVAGQVYVILVRGNSDVHDRNTLAGPAILEVADVVGADETPEASKC